jgi:uncharacterized membrane protein
VDTWTTIRFLHVLALALFIGGQLVLVFAIAPVMRRRPDDAAMRAIARRFGIAAAVALGVLLATGVAMADRFGRWGDHALQLKLMLLVLVTVLIVFHALVPHSRALSGAVLLGSVAIVWIGVGLSH